MLSIIFFIDEMVSVKLLISCCYHREISTAAKLAVFRECNGHLVELRSLAWKVLICKLSLIALRARDVIKFDPLERLGQTNRFSSKGIWSTMRLYPVQVSLKLAF